jgi:tetratricopeptide (TPR) repeat protein
LTDLRRPLVLLVALLLAVQVIRNAVVAALAPGSPRVALRVWPGHPAAELSLATADIRRAAREGKLASPFAFAMIDDAARKAPLAAEPFLARGVEQRLAGNSEVAVQSFLAAKRRDPRSPAARYFLADLYYHGDDTARALQELAALARLAPDGIQKAIPYIAVYTRDRSTWPRLREMFRSNPSLEDAALTALASDPSNADVVLALAGPQNVVRVHAGRVPW